MTSSHSCGVGRSVREGNTVKNYIINIYFLYGSKSKEIPKNELTLFRRIKDKNKEEKLLGLGS